METERPPRSIDQQYECTTNLDKYWRKSQRKEKILMGKREDRSQEQRQQTRAVNNPGEFRPCVSSLQIWLKRQKILKKNQQNQFQWKEWSVVATTRWNSTCSLLTSAKLLVGYLVVEIYKRTRQGALTALLLYLYKYKVVRATTMCLPHVLLLIYHASSSRPLCYIYVL